MNKNEPVGYAADGAIYCADCWEARSSLDEAMPIFGWEERADWDYCADCEQPIVEGGGLKWRVETIIEGVICDTECFSSENVAQEAFEAEYDGLRRDGILSGLWELELWLEYGPEECELIQQKEGNGRATENSAAIALAYAKAREAWPDWSRRQCLEHARLAFAWDNLLGRVSNESLKAMGLIFGSVPALRAIDSMLGYPGAFWHLSPVRWGSPESDRAWSAARALLMRLDCLGFARPYNGQDY